MKRIQKTFVKYVVHVKYTVSLDFLVLKTFEMSSQTLIALSHLKFVSGIELKTKPKKKHNI